jgi:predicted DNA-binding transcriptional regulator YafY
VIGTSARLLRLLSLLQARRFWAGADLAERLQVTARTLRRDIDRLRTLGYPVHATSGVAGGYQLGAGAVLPPLHLEEDEALAVSLALGSAASMTVSGIEDAALRALAKLEQVLPARLRRRANALRASIVPIERAGGRVEAELLSTLAGACREHEELSFRYTGARGAPSERRVEPQGLVHTGYRWYLVAWDRDREDFRTFRVDRIAGKVSVGKRFAPRAGPEGGDLRAYVSRSLAVAPYPAQARVVLHAPLEAMADRISPTYGLLERLDEQRCVLQAGAPSFEILSVWLLFTGVDFHVEEPPELATHLRALAERLGRCLEETA